MRIVVPKNRKAIIPFWMMAFLILDLGCIIHSARCESGLRL